MVKADKPLDVTVGVIIAPLPPPPVISTPILDVYDEPATIEVVLFIPDDIVIFGALQYPTPGFIKIIAVIIPLETVAVAEGVGAGEGEEVTETLADALIDGLAEELMEGDEEALAEGLTEGLTEPVTDALAEEDAEELTEPVIDALA